MTTKERFKIDDKFKDERLRVLLALAAAKKTVPAGPCPPAEILAAFVDGRLSRNERKKMLQHLDSCAFCYEDWLSLSSIADRQGGSDRQKIMPLHGLPKKSRRIWWGGGFALSLAASLIFILWWSTWSAAPFEKPIVESYRMALEQHVAPTGADLLQAIPLPWERPSVQYGFGASSSLSPAVLAFSAGLWSGRELLSARATPSSPPRFLTPLAGKDSSKSEGRQDGEWAPYYWLGRWCVLIKAACQTPASVPLAFWTRQRQTIERMEATFSSRAKTEEEARSVMAVMPKLKSVLDGFGHDADNLRACRTMGKEIDSLMDRLGPGQ